jgi:hypothetical protein
MATDKPQHLSEKEINNYIECHPLPKQFGIDTVRSTLPCKNRATFLAISNLSALSQI